ncbi:MAG TPA: glycosyl hydrolase [Acidobacteriaceae bacterium]|nr:glycosyl hydrolase [Acidobacteriaceae bacterium]
MLGKKYIRTFTATLAFAVAAPVLPQSAPSLDLVRKNFANPPIEARPMVRWWWFGPAVVKPEILTELEQMKADGIQGAELAFVYPEVLDDPAKGLKNLPFLSPQMLDMVTYAKDEGRKLGLRIDVTLCSGWPYGGPHIPLSQAVTRLRVAEVPVAANATTVNVPKLEEGETLLSAVIADPAKNPVAPPSNSRGRGPRPPSFDAATAKPLTVSGISAALTSTDAPRVAVFFIQSHTKQQVKRAAVDAEGYVLDPFSHDAVANHLKSVGEPLVKAFGTTPPYAIFSDSLEAYGADWTPNLPAEFKKRRGYDLMPHLAELVAGTGVGADNLRHDYGKTLTELINENYLVQITDWAKAHNTKFRSQTYGEPAVSFSSQNLVSLAEGEGPQWRQFSTLRWATSANHVFNHNVTSGETFTWLHSPVFRATPLDMKAEADIDFIMGENQIICHGWPYSPPDHEVPEPGWSLYAAAVFNNHNPWHPVMPAVTAYIGRMSYLLRQGQSANQVAVLLPTDDAWASFRPTQTTLTGAFSRLITPELVSSILSAGYNLDFIDADAINSTGLGTHQVVIIPPTKRIPVSTAEKLLAWQSSGGKIICVGDYPSLTDDGKDLTEALRASGGPHEPPAVAPTAAQLPALLHDAVRPDFSLSDAGDNARNQIGFIRRKLPNADIYVVVNTSNTAVDVTATFATDHKSAEEWDPDTAQSTAASATSQAIHLEPYGSRVFVFSDVAALAPAKQMDASAQRAPALDISSDWKLDFVGLKKTVNDSVLKDWISDPSTEHYSGEVIYSRDVQLGKAPAGSVYLSINGGKPLPGAPNTNAQTAVLGSNGLPDPRVTRPGPGMHAYFDPPLHEAALVSINAQPAGALWHPPYRLDVTKLLRAGTNHIEIHVYNTAINAWSAEPPRDYGPLIEKYGDRFQMQDICQPGSDWARHCVSSLKPISSGILGSVELQTETK